jgi:hypothetical protein
MKAMVEAPDNPVTELQSMFFEMTVVQCVKREDLEVINEVSNLPTNAAISSQ